MEISEEGLAHIRRFEGLRLRAYKDPAGVWTIGYGHTGPEVHDGQRISEEEAEALLRADVERIEAGVARVAGEARQQQIDALVSFAFNVGLTALRVSTLIRKHRAGDHEGAAREFGRWVYAGGRRLEGLRRRRAAEAALYRS
jgi:lysozyme